MSPRCTAPAQNCLLEVRLHGGKQRGVAGSVQGVRDGIRIEFTGQRAQRRPHLRRTANAGVQALVIGLTEGQLLGGRARARAGGRDRQGNALNELAFERCAHAAENHYAYAGFSGSRTLIRTLTRTTAAACAP